MNALYDPVKIQIVYIITCCSFSFSVWIKLITAPNSVPLPGYDLFFGCTSFFFCVCVCGKYIVTCKNMTIDLNTTINPGKKDSGNITSRGELWFAYLGLV